MRTETWTILRAGDSTGDDRYGAPIPGEPVAIPLGGCLFAQASTDEPVAVGRSAVITTATLYAPAGADVRHDDRLRSPTGNEYEVQGEPARWPGSGVVVALKAANG